MKIREYLPEKDFTSVERIWRETGWIRDTNKVALEYMLNSGTCTVGEMNSEAESLAISSPGSLQYLDESIPFSGVLAVSTSHIARKKGLGLLVTAESVAQEALNGALVSGLGCFDQGYYDKLGFGTGSYERFISFDPATLSVNLKADVPLRLTRDDWEEIHNSRLNRRLYHGSCTIFNSNITKAELTHSAYSFGLGYKDGKEITHMLWFKTENIRHGPYFVSFLTFKTKNQFHELLALLKNLSDQITLIKMLEPINIQFQDILERPIRTRRITQNSTEENTMISVAFWQMRICHLENCIEKTHLSGEKVDFNLHLDDPIEKYLKKESEWKGISGDYIVSLGSYSRAEKGNNQNLPTLKASVGAFTRMWLGVLPPSGLTFTDSISGPSELIKSLDKVCRLPQPKIDWDL